MCLRTRVHTCTGTQVPRVTYVWQRTTLGSPFVVSPCGIELGTGDQTSCEGILPLSHLPPREDRI